jgi:hypothetical protein
MGARNADYRQYVQQDEMSLFFSLELATTAQAMIRRRIGQKMK